MWNREKERNMIPAHRELEKLQQTDMKVAEHNMEHYIFMSRLCGITYKNSKKGRVNLKWIGQLY